MGSNDKDYSNYVFDLSEVDVKSRPFFRVSNSQATYLDPNWDDSSREESKRKKLNWMIEHCVTTNHDHSHSRHLIINKQSKCDKRQAYRYCLHINLTQIPVIRSQSMFDVIMKMVKQLSHRSANQYKLGVNKSLSKW